MQGKWAPPPATLAVCQLTYRHCLLVSSPVNVSLNPSPPSSKAKSYQRRTLWDWDQNSELAPHPSSLCLSPETPFTGSRSRQLCVLSSAQAPPRSLHRVSLTFYGIEVSSCLSGVFIPPMKKRPSPGWSMSWRLPFLQETTKSRATSVNLTLLRVSMLAQSKSYLL